MPGYLNTIEFNRYQTHFIGVKLFVILGCLLKKNDSWISFLQQK